MTRYAGGTPVPYPLRESADFRFDPDELRALVTPRTKLIILNSPHNPTGGVLTRGDLEAIADVARERDIMVLADEIYGRLVYEGEQVSIASLPGMAERTIVLDGFSKAYAMTAGDFTPSSRPARSRRTQADYHSVSCTSSFEQIAAAEALNGPRSRSTDGGRIPRPARPRRRWSERYGIRCRQPHGVLRLPNVAGTGMSGSQFTERMLHEGNVCVLSGTAFGQTGPDHIRISYANSQANLRRAIERIEEVVAKTPAATPA
jgi:aspartate/methionine/tyrosine aminotransferase